MPGNMIPDQFQLELQALLKKYGKEIKVAINPIIVDVPQTVPEVVAEKVLKGKKKV